MFSVYSIYHKLVETYHVVSECNTAVYFIFMFDTGACPTGTAVLTVVHF